MIWGSKFSKMVTSLGEASSGEDGEFVVDMPKKAEKGRRDAVVAILTTVAILKQ